GELDGGAVGGGDGGIGIGAGDFDDDAAGGPRDRGVEFGAVGVELDVLIGLRRDVDLGCAGVDADDLGAHVGGAVELGGEVLLHFGEDRVVGGGGRNGDLEEL